MVRDPGDDVVKRHLRTPQTDTSSPLRRQALPLHVCSTVRTAVAQRIEVVAADWSL